VSCQATDQHGNTGHGSFHITVEDTTPPVLTVPGDMTVEADGPAGTVVNYSVSATDNVDPNPKVACDPPSGSTFQIRVTPVTCTATDASGNSSSKTFRIIVRDTTPPTLTIPGNITIQASNDVGTTVDFAVKATDTVDPAPSVDCKPPSGSVFPVGKTTVRCTAEDASGNAVTKSFLVTVTSPSGGGAKPPPPPPQPLPPPPPGPPGSVNAKPVPGKPDPQVKLPGSNQFVPLSQAKALPPGTVVNVSGQAQIQLSDATNKQMVFFGVPDSVPSLFTLVGKQGGVVKLSLSGGSFKCGKVSKFARKTSGLSAKPKKPVRRLWGTGKGKFTTNGKYASATVRGTEWLVADYCTGTLIQVRKGLVSVRDLVQNKTKLVPAGKSYFAPSTKPKKK
jgi:hypothetical protein